MTNLLKDIAVLLFSAGDEIEQKADEFKKLRKDRLDKVEGSLKDKFDKVESAILDKKDDLVDRFGFVTSKQIEDLQKQVDKLSAKVDKLSKK